MDERQSREAILKLLATDPTFAQKLLSNFPKMDPPGTHKLPEWIDNPEAADKVQVISHENLIDGQSGQPLQDEEARKRALQLLSRGQ